MPIYTRTKYMAAGIACDDTLLFSTPIILDADGKRRIEPEALSELLDRICLALNQEEVRKAAPHCPWPVGTRVKLIQDFEYFDCGIVPAGEFGRVVNVCQPDTQFGDEVMGEVRLEKYHDGLDEWENCIIVMGDPSQCITWASFTPADDQDGEG